MTSALEVVGSSTGLCCVCTRVGVYERRCEGRWTALFLQLAVEARGATRASASARARETCEAFLRPLR
eukprot:255022-Pleurochrysis_carterae.AAC.2